MLRTWIQSLMLNLCLAGFSCCFSAGTELGVTCQATELGDPFCTQLMFAVTCSMCTVCAGLGCSAPQPPIGLASPPQPPLNFVGRHRPVGLCRRSNNLENFKISKNLRMGFSIVENLSGLSGSMFSLFRSPQFSFREKSQSWSDSSNFIDFFQIPPVGCPY